MPTISRYVVSPTPDTWSDALSEYDTYAEARDVAIEQQGCVTEITYEFSDTELVDDFRPSEDEDGDPIHETGPDDGDQVQAED